MLSRIHYPVNARHTTYPLFVVIVVQTMAVANVITFVIYSWALARGNVTINILIYIYIYMLQSYAHDIFCLFSRIGRIVYYIHSAYYVYVILSVFGTNQIRDTEIINYHALLCGTSVFEML